MELLFAELIASGKVPKPIRYLLAVIDAGFIVFLGVLCGTGSPFLLGKCFGWGVAILGVIVGVFMVRRIHSGKPFPLNKYDD